MEHIRKVYFGILLVAFLYSISKSYMNVLKEHTTIEEYKLNIPLLDAPTQGYQYVGFEIKNDSRRLYYVKHEHKQSEHNFEIDRSTSFQILYPKRGTEEYLIQTETTSLKTSQYDCIEDNSMLRKDCIDEFVTEELQCNLPWILTQDQIGLQECQTEEDLKSYRNLSFRITSPILKQKLVDDRK